MTLSDIVSVKYSTRALGALRDVGPAMSLANRFFYTGEEVRLAGYRWTGVKTFVLKDEDTLSDDCSRYESVRFRTHG